MSQQSLLKGTLMKRSATKVSGRLADERTSESSARDSAETKTTIVSLSSCFHVSAESPERDSDEAKCHKSVREACR